MIVCGLQHEYSDRICVLPKGHDRADDWDPHRAADGLQWVHHADLVGHDERGDEVWDIWDEDDEEQR